MRAAILLRKFSGGGRCKMGSQRDLGGDSPSDKVLLARPKDLMFTASTTTAVT